MRGSGNIPASVDYRCVSYQYDCHRPGAGPSIVIAIDHPQNSLSSLARTTFLASL